MSDSLDYSVKLLINIHLFLNKVSFCVVQTGDVKDAYLLFEVLNDRSLALDDLDLIKNQFYKNFVIKNEEINDDEIDKTIQEIDKQWVNDIFSERTPASLKKLVAYFGITFITGDTTLKYTDGRTYRDSIQKYLENKNSYNPEDIKIHFRIFHVCKTILSDILNIPFQKTESYALLNEYKQSVSSFVKVISYLHAKKQYGVLAGLMNFTLRYYQHYIKDLTVDINQLKEILNDLVKNCPVQIREQSFELWKTSMLAKSEAEPRDLAIKIIKRNKLDSELSDMQRPDNLQALNTQFDDWLSSWSYNKDDFKVRILFAKFFGLDIENDILVRRTAQLSLDEDNIKSLQLDHLEPQKITSSNPKAYFIHNNREAYINSLGNLIPLTAELNNQKSNKPLSEGLKYFIDFGIEHHPLYKNIIDMLAGKMVPDENFFINRTQWLKSIFKDLVYFPPNK